MDNLDKIYKDLFNGKIVEFQCPPPCGEIVAFHTTNEIVECKFCERKYKYEPEIKEVDFKGSILPLDFEYSGEPIKFIEVCEDDDDSKENLTSNTSLFPSIVKKNDDVEISQINKDQYSISGSNNGDVIAVIKFGDDEKKTIDGVTVDDLIDVIKDRIESTFDNSYDKTKALFFIEESLESLKKANNSIEK